MHTDDMNKKSGFSSIVIPIVIVAVAIAGIGGAVLYQNFFGSVKTPDQIVSESLSNFLQAKAFTYEAEAIGKASGALNGSLKLAGGVDYFKPENPKLLAIFNVDITEGRDRIIGEVEVRLIEDSAYVKLSAKNLPKEGFLSLLNAFANQWIKIDASGVSKFIDEEQANKTEDYIKKNKQARDILSKHFRIRQLFKVESEIGEEEVSGVSVTHYVVYIDQLALSQAISAIYSDFDEAGLIKPEDRLSAADLEKMETSIKSETDFPKFDFWIEADQQILRKISLNFGVKESFLRGVSVTFTDYNKPLSIEAPEGAKSIEEIFDFTFGANVPMIQPPTTPGVIPPPLPFGN